MTFAEHNSSRKRFNFAGGTWFIHAVGRSGVACPQRRMARAMSHESCSSATASFVEPISAAAAQRGQRSR